MQNWNCKVLQIGALGLICIVNVTHEMINSCIPSQALSPLHTLTYENYTPIVQVDKEYHLQLFKQNQRRHGPHTHMMEPVFKFICFKSMV